MKKINFVTNKQKLRQMAYGDAIYAWLLLHSHYDENENQINMLGKSLEASIYVEGFDASEITTCN